MYAMFLACGDIVGSDVGGLGAILDRLLLSVMSRCLKCTKTRVRIWPLNQIDDETLGQPAIMH